MLVLGIPIFIVITLLPGYLAVRLLQNGRLRSLGAFVYSVGFGLLFLVLVGAVANFTFGLNLLAVVVSYIIAVGILGLVSWQFGKKVNIKWLGWKPLIIPTSTYLLALGLQLQTTLMSPNLVGSDIHLEYFVSNMVLEQGFWNPMYSGTTLNTFLGLALLLPVYKLFTGLSLMLVFKVISPMIFAVLPVILYQIFSMQFSKVVAVLAVAFFISMPMFTMDMVQLIRQQQAMLFFMLVVLVLLDSELSIRRKMIVGSLFVVGAITMHIGIAIGFIGYLLAGSFVVVLLSVWWKKKVDDAKKPILSRVGIVIFLLMSVIVYVGYYGWVGSGAYLSAGVIPIQIAQKTTEQVVAGIQETKEITQKAEEVIPEANVKSEPSVSTPPVSWDKPPSSPEDRREKVVVASDVPFFQRFSFLDPLRKEPITQTAIGLDFTKASTLGKIWRVLQYLVEVCLVVGFFKILLKPPKNIQIEYMAFVIASFFVLAGLYLLSTYGWGLGAIRVWAITLLFMSPLFVIGCQTIGKWLAWFKKIGENKMALFSTLVLFVPYAVFNLGVVFEVAKLKPVGFIDVPYSIALSGNRVDIASVFTVEDVEAMDWLKERYLAGGSNESIYADTHGGNLLVQRLGDYMTVGDFKYLWEMTDSDVGYIFLRKLNVDNSELTTYGDYASRQSHSIDDYDIAKQKIENGEVIFDNGARVIEVSK